MEDLGIIKNLSMLFVKNVKKFLPKIYLIIIAYIVKKIIYVVY